MALVAIDYHWDDVDNIEVVAVEQDQNIAQCYKDRYPKDEIVIDDAYEYLLNNYKKFDFIWASPPCQSHSRIRRMAVDVKNYKAVYPDFKMYQMIVFLNSYFNGKWIVENVIPFYQKPKLEIFKYNYNIFNTQSCYHLFYL